MRGGIEGRGEVRGGKEEGRVVGEKGWGAWREGGL